MYFVFLVEEESLQIALEPLLTTILGDAEIFEIHAFKGKPDLLKKLPSRLRAYRLWLPDDWRIVVMIDEDRQDCKVLKIELENIAHNAGFETRTSSPDGYYQVLNRIVIEELEAWFFGDVQALVKAYPKISPNLAKEKKYRDPDAIQGGTWEALEHILQDKKYHQGGLEKLKAARDISPHMQPEQNTSKSFQVFYQALQELMQNNPI